MHAVVRFLHSTLGYAIGLAAIRSLRVGSVDLESLKQIMVIYGAHPGMDGRQMGLRLLRFEDSGRNTGLIDWFRLRVYDFALTRRHSNGVSSLLGGPTAHSAF